MKIFLMIGILLSLCFCFAEGQMGHQRRLRKLTIHLTGRIPTLAEQEELETIPLHKREKFFREKTDQLLQSELFVQHFSNYLKELFFLSSFSSQIGSDPLESLFEKVIRNNLDWDQLLLSKEYEIDFTDNNMYYSNELPELSFYDFALKGPSFQVASNEIRDYLEKNGSYPQGNYVLRADTEEQKEALAGTITTPRFFDRYTTNKKNRNRRRAAAVFRIFLCDNMKPVILSTDNNNKDILYSSLDATEVTSPVTDDSAEKRHGSDASCKGCHYKLDPLANTFRGSSRQLNKATPGRLTYKKESGEMVDIPVSGLGELGEVITQQEEYLQCQVRHFWNWYIGEDIFLDKENLKKLTKIFEKSGDDGSGNGRRPKDFIRYLVNSKDFYTEKEFNPTEVRYSHVKNIFKRCDVCHENEVLAPHLSEGYPFSANKNDNLKALQILVKALNLDEKQASAVMPPRRAGWRLSQEETSIISAWLQSGAQDEKGNKYVESNAFPGIVIGLEKLQLIPSFYNTFYRYMDFNEFTTSMTTLFGQDPDPKYACYANYGDSALVVPATGKPHSKSVTNEYYSMVKYCVSTLFSSHKVSASSLVLPYFNEAEFMNIKKPWKSWSYQQQRQFVNVVYERLTGKTFRSNSIPHQLIASLNKKVTSGKNQQSINEALYWLSYLLMTSDKFLIY